MRRRLADEQGFSLTEVAVAAALLMVVLLPLLRFFDGAVSDAGALQRSTQLHADGRAAIDALTRELRQAYSGDATPPVVVDPSGLGLTILSPDTSTPFRLRKIVYTVAAGQLLRSSTPSNQTSCPDTTSACTGYGPAWTFGPARPSVPVMSVRTTLAFTAVTVNGALRQVKISLTGLNSAGRADRLFQTSVDLRNV